MGPADGEGRGAVRIASEVEPPEGRGTWLAVAAAALAVVVGWSVLSGAGDSAPASTTASSTPTSEAPPSSTVVSTPVTSALGSTTPPTTVVLGDGEPLLGRTTGLSLVVTSPDLVLVDLDTGEIRSIAPAGTNLEPRAVVGHHLIASRFGELVSVDLRTGDSAELELDGWGGPFGDPAPDGQAWFAEPDRDGYAAVRVDLATGLVVERVALPAEVTPSSDSLRFASPAGGGVYEVFGSGVDGPRFIVEGGLLAVLDDNLLVQQCDERLVCERRWYDPVARDHVDGLGAPDPPSWCRALGTEWLWCEGSFSADAYQQFLFSPASGERIDLGPESSYIEPAISPNSDVVAYAGPLGITLYDLATRSSIVIDDADFANAWHLQIVATEALD